VRRRAVYSRGLSAAARTARLSGGFKSSATDPILIGQVQLVDMGDPVQAMEALKAHRVEIVNLANSLHPKMVARGGGARDIELFRYTAPEDGRQMVVMHLLVDTRDAMGANLVNTMCEGVASLVESITGGKVFLRILSNLTDRALARAQMVIPVNISRARVTAVQRSATASSSRTISPRSIRTEPRRTTKAS
jgi:hydroxymethylglutaryl-CoA reductase